VPTARSLSGLICKCGVLKLAHPCPSNSYTPALAERLAQEPKPIRRLKINSSPLLYPLWDIAVDRFLDQNEEELTRRASSVRADDAFMAALTRAAASSEPVYPPSEHVELQSYRGNFFSDADRELCRQFQASPWEVRMEFVGRFDDIRLERLARWLIYYESPHLFEETDRRAIAEDIFAPAARRRQACPSTVDDHRPGPGRARGHGRRGIGRVQAGGFVICGSCPCAHFGVRPALLYSGSLSEVAFFQTT
jgi:hypothetical protein